MAFGAVVQLGSLNGTNGFKIVGETPGDYLGASVSRAGDVNGDGYDDIIVGAWLANPNGPLSGASYVIFGKAGGFLPFIGVEGLTGANGFRISETTAGADGFSVSGGGDINGDGYDDVIVGARWDGTNSRGGAQVIFGHAGAFAANINPAALNGTTGFRVVGVEDEGQAGRAVANAGDINGDGTDDFLVSAPYADVVTGITYVVFGKTTAFSASLDLSTLTGTNGFRIVGAAEVTNTGYSIAGAADINGDGYDDIIIGAPSVATLGFRTGATYVVYGKAGGFGATLNVGDLNGTNGFTIEGAAGLTDSGHSVSGAGDLNGDGYDDVVVGAHYSDPNGADSGATYVVFGGAAGTSTISLASLNGSNGFQIVGVAAGDQSGYSVSSAGDVNGDGLGDLIIGGPKADGIGADSGSAWVVYGKTSGFGAVLNLASLNGTNGFEIRGEATGDTAGWSVSAAGDVNGDGIDDLIVGARDYGTGNGAAYVIFGQAAGPPPVNVITGTAGADRIAGTFDNDQITGLGGNDNLSGAFGDDTLDGGDGSDKLFGYNGDDTLIGGAGNDQIYGEYGDDALNGGAGIDTLDGGFGADAMTGGDGNDVYYVDDAGDQTIELLFEGVDIVRTSLGWTLADNVEQLELQGTGNVNGTGNISANRLIGNTGDNVLDGGVGVDTINGGDGDDTIIGGLDNDLLRGGTGADTFVVAHAFGVILETDQVYDFSTAEGDIIDLTGAFSGTIQKVNTFTKHAGEMTLTFASGVTTLKLDINGDGRTDYQMKINGDVTGDSAGWLL